MIRISNNIKTHLLLVLVAVFWGVTPAFMKVSLLEIDVFIFSTLRLFTALMGSGIFVSFLFLNESLTLLQIAGGFVIMAGVFLVNRKNT